MNAKCREATVTVKDIARESGLSPSTVIHILGGREKRYREETSEAYVCAGCSESPPTIFQARTQKT